MSIIYDYVKKPDTPQDAEHFLRNTEFFDLCQDYWNKRGQVVYGKPLSFNVYPFMMLWLQGGIVVITAKENDKMVGLLIAMRFVPMMFQANVIQPDLIYGINADIEQGLMNKLTETARFWDIEQLWLTSDIQCAEVNWPKKDTITLSIYENK